MSGTKLYTSSCSVSCSYHATGDQWILSSSDNKISRFMPLHQLWMRQQEDTEFSIPTQELKLYQQLQLGRDSLRQRCGHITWRLMLDLINSKKTRKSTSLGLEPFERSDNIAGFLYLWKKMSETLWTTGLPSFLKPTMCFNPIRGLFSFGLILLIDNFLKY